MNKILLVFVAVIGLLVLGFYAFNNYIYNEKQGGNENMDNTNNSAQFTENGIEIVPIEHATVVLNIGDQVVYVDPVGGAEAFAGRTEPTLILITDIHGDHMDAETLKAVSKAETVLIMPQVVASELPNDIPGTRTVLANGEKTTQGEIEIEAFPMYNVPESADAFHTKGRGNGYILTAMGKRVYIAGDTAGTPEMKALQNIDIAFVPMNLPYTMDVEEAAEAVLAFKPKVVHPYHYRGQDGLADINKFKQLVNEGDPNISVELLNFYPEE